MRIISEYRDYYDCIQAHGQDQSLLYLRKSKEVKFENGEWPFVSVDRWWFWSTDVTCHVIGFCGKVYPMLEFCTMTDPYKAVKCFNIDEVDAFIEANSTSAQKRYYREKSSWRSRGINRRIFMGFFDECNKKQDSYMDYFTEKRCPVFVATYRRCWGTITYNAQLKPLDFVRIFDPYTAFQEISMFMGGMAMPEKEMPIIPDELKIYSRGFNKWSFRRRPGGR